MSRNYAKQPLKIFIAVGHGGADPGAVYGNYREAEFNRTVASLMKQDLQRHGVQVLLSRTKDEDDRLKEEIAECNAYQPDFAIAIHTNASADGKATGFEVYHQNSSWENGTISRRMAELMDKHVKNHLNVSTRGLKTNPHLGWLKQVNAPCVLCENFFINGPKVHWYSQQTQLEALSKAYTRAVLDLYGISYRSDDVFVLNIRVVQDDLQTAKNCCCNALLVNGSNFVQLREIARLLGWGVHYEESTRTILLYPPQYYAESQFAGGLLKLSDFPTEAERILAGLPVQPEPDTDSDYSFDEYDYNEDGQLEQTQRLVG